jgi:integration host factor subunit beta
LCTFFAEEFDGYTGRNPKTGERVKIKVKKLPFLKPGKELKYRVDLSFNETMFIKNAL